MNRALTYTLVTLLVLVALPFVVLYGLYFKGAREIPPSWGPTTVTYPDAARVAQWRWYGGEGLPQRDPMSPPEFAWRGYRASGEIHAGRPMDVGMTMAGGAARPVRFMASHEQGSHHLMEFAAAIQASRWSVESQLDTTLENAPFGPDIRGLRAAALRYFGAPVESLDAPGLWVLLAIGHSPTYFNPWCKRDRLREFALERAVQRHARLAPAEIDAALDSLAPMPQGHQCGSG